MKQHAFNGGGEVFSTVKDVISLATTAAAYNSSSSLIEFAGVGNVEPIVVIDTECTTYDFTTDVLNSLQSIFTATYMQAFNLLGTIGDIKVAKYLDRLNPNRSLDVTSVFESKLDYKQNNFKFKLPTFRAATEDESSAQIQKDNNRSVNERTDLSVGKLIRVSMSKDDKKFSFDVAIRLMVRDAPGRSLLTYLSLGDKSTKSISDDYYDYKIGKKGLFDIFFNLDVYNEYKKALMLDKNGSFNEVIRRAQNSKKAGIISQNPSLATASTMYVISSNTANLLELEVGGKLSNTRVRQKIFDGSYAMILCVIRREHNQVTFYYRNNDSGTTVSVADLKSASAGTGPNINEIFRSLADNKQVVI